jgi:hypothetical protein
MKVMQTEVIQFLSKADLVKGQIGKRGFNKGVPIINHDISISGGSDKVTYSVSGSHLDQEGIIGGNKSGF